MLVNLYWAYRSLAASFNIVPGGSLEAHAPRIISGLTLLVVLGWVTVVTLRRIRAYSVGRQLVCGAALLSLAVVGMLYLVGRWQPALMVGRFLPNFYYLTPLLAAMIAADDWRAWPRAAKAALVGYAALFMSAGAASASPLWISPNSGGSLESEEAAALATFLQSRGLAYGYGPFWGSHALVMDTISAGQVVIRPVTFRAGRIARRPAETASYWYAAADEPTAPRRFVIVRNDGEECVPPTDCVDMARRQFGPPSEEHVFRDFRVLVWPKPISARIDK